MGMWRGGGERVQVKRERGVAGSEEMRRGEVNKERVVWASAHLEVVLCRRVDGWRGEASGENALVAGEEVGDEPWGGRVRLIMGLVD